MKFLFTTLLLISPLFADSDAAYPPNPYDTAGGKRSPAFSEANAQAMHFINLIDQQQYGGSWLEAGALMQDVITQEQWRGAMDSTRTALGPVYARKVGSHQTAKTLPGGTKGNFMIIKYETQFAQKANASETITLMTEGKLGLWKVIAYRVGN